MTDPKRPIEFVPGEGPVEIVPRTEGPVTDVAVLHMMQGTLVTVFDRLAEHASIEEKARLNTLKTKEMVRANERQHEVTLAHARHHVQVVLGALVIVALFLIAAFALYRDKDPIVADVLKIATGVLGGYGLGRANEVGSKRKREREA